MCLFNEIFMSGNWGVTTNPSPIKDQELVHNDTQKNARGGQKFNTKTCKETQFHRTQTIQLKPCDNYTHKSITK